MGITKLELYDRETIVLAKMCQAMGHPARIRILDFIRMDETETCLHLSNKIGLHPSTISSHLLILVRVGFITGEPHINEAHYRINFDVLERFEKLLHHRLWNLIAI